MLVGGIPFKSNKRLSAEARRLGQHRTDEKAIKAALEKYVRLLRQRRILRLFGTIDFDPEYDYKAGAPKKAHLTIGLDTSSLRRRANTDRDFVRYGRVVHIRLMNPLS